MKISSKQYAQVLFELVKGKSSKDLELSLKGFARLLSSRNDDFKLAKIILDFEALWYQEFSVVKAEIKSTRKLSPEMREMLSSKLISLTKAKELLLEERIDQAVIAGATIKYGDHILDASLKNRIQKFKEALAL